MANKELYKKICEDHQAEIPVFAKYWWLNAVCREWDFAVASKGEHTTGIWPYPIEKKAGVSILRTPMVTPYMGPVVFFPADVKQSNRDNFEHETVSALIKQIADSKVWHLAVQPGMKQAGIFRKHQAEAVVQQTFLVDLMQDEAALLANMKDTIRRNIRNAEKDITITDDPAQLGTLYQFQKNTLEKKGKALPYSLADLELVMQACRENNSASLWVATVNNTVQAIVWQVWDAQCSYYLAGGQNPASSSNTAMTYLLWHAMKQAKAKGQKTFDLEGSMDEGVERFFRGFGGKRELYIILKKNESILWKVKEMVRK